MTVKILLGDCRDVLPTMAAGSVQCCVTSPPYYGLRDYGVDGQIGLEASPDEYVAQMVAVFREVRRVLREDGTLWLNVGDSYNNFRSQMGPGQAVHGRDNLNGKPAMDSKRRGWDGAKEKDLLGIPWMLAFALRADGWYLRSDIIWHKPNPMPESVRDRPTSAHEHVFLMSKSQRYFYNADAIRQPLADASYSRLAQDIDQQAGSDRANGGAKTNGTMKAVKFGGNKKQGDHGSAARRASGRDWEPATETANARSVWTIATQPYSGAHFATMAPDLAERCIRAGTKPGDMVLDPFGGAGTTGMVADRLGRDATLIEINPAYREIARDRLREDAPLLVSVTA
jgi:DNA modification methylase